MIRDTSKKWQVIKHIETKHLKIEKVKTQTTRDKKTATSPNFFLDTLEEHKDQIKMIFDVMLSSYVKTTSHTNWKESKE